MKDQAMRLKIGVSSCLLGQKVRFDGEGKRHRWLTDELGKFADFLPLCPEMAMGLGSPREAMRIIKDSDTGVIDLQTSRSKKIMTSQAESTVDELLQTSHLDSIDGYVLMANSPLCGIRHIKVYETKNNIPHKTGEGFFAKKLRERFPTLPLTEQGRLSDPGQRSAFLCHVFLYHQLRSIEKTPKAFQEFHREHKFLLLSYHPQNYRRLGKLVAAATKVNIDATLETYKILLHGVFSQPRTTARGTDALMHILGFFKNQLNRNQKQNVLQAIEDYKNGLTPFSVPLNILQFVNANHSSPYIEEQSIFEPYPLKLG